MNFGDPITVTTGARAQLAVFLWRPDGCEPVTFLDGRAVLPDLAAILTPWRCLTCHGSRLFWGVRIAPRCATCQPPSIAEKEFLLMYVTGCVRSLADRLDDPARKAALLRLLDEAIATGDSRRLVELSLEALAGGWLLKHEEGAR